jgi:hypothetical protein
MVLQIRLGDKLTCRHVPQFDMERSAKQFHHWWYKLPMPEELQDFSVLTMTGLQITCHVCGKIWTVGDDHPA